MTAPIARQLHSFRYSFLRPSIILTCALTVGSVVHGSPEAALAQQGPDQGQVQQGKSDANVEGARSSTAAPSVIVNVGAAQSNQARLGAEGRTEQGSNADWWVAGATIALAAITLVLAVFTGFLWRSTKETSSRQAGEMKDSIAEAVRAADAMESVAEATRANALLMQGTVHKQMRAYVSVELLTAIYQDERLFFEGKPALENTGFTPARNISYRFMADVLPANLTPNYTFAIPAEEVRNDASLAPRQKLVAGGCVIRRRFTDAEVIEIMAGEKRRLYIWGTVDYDDIFGGQRWQTNFCVSVVFTRLEGKNVRPDYYYHPVHNNAT